MSEDGTCLEQIESDEIKKLVELIYGGKPEITIEEGTGIDDHEKIIKRVNQIIGHD